MEQRFYDALQDCPIIAAVRNEAGGGWALASMVYSTAVAWFVAWSVYHIALLF